MTIKTWKSISSGVDVKWNDDIGLCPCKWVLHAEQSKILIFLFSPNGPSIWCATKDANTTTSVSSSSITTASDTPDFLSWEYMKNRIVSASICRHVSSHSSLFVDILHVLQQHSLTEDTNFVPTCSCCASLLSAAWFCFLSFETCY